MDCKALEMLLDQLPDSLREEVFDYASYLMERKAPRSGDARRANLHRGSVRLSDDFGAPLSDRFWLGE